MLSSCGSWSGLPSPLDQQCADPFDGFFDVLGRVGVGEADVALSVDAEGRAGDGRDAGLFEHLVLQFLGAHAGPGDVWEGIERGAWIDARDTRQLVEQP